MSLFAEIPHRRYNPLQDEWVLVSPHRTKRPWQGQQESVPPDDRPPYDPTCYLCPGNERVGGVRNPAYESTFVFDNDFAALLPETIDAPPTTGLFRQESVTGESRVICFSPRHDLTLAKMSPEEMAPVIDCWADQITDLGETYRWVQIFENRGTSMGASNPHPHGQVWAMSALPTLAAREDAAQRAYLAAHGSPMLVDMAAAEAASGERVVAENRHWVLVVPFWAVWPFEYLLLPKRHVLRLPDLTPDERISLAEILGDGLRKYDALFNAPFPYTMGWHGAPTGPGGEAEGYEHWQLHAHYFPPLLRSATIRKFMVGFEMLAEAQRDLTPESAAARLRTAGQP